MNVYQNHLLDSLIGQGKKQLLIAIGAIHGNETAGIKAIEKVFAVLKNTKIPFNGTFVGLIGNLLAIEQKTRFIKNDLNRIWTIDDLEFIEHEFDTKEFPEHSQLKELLKIIDDFLYQGFEEIVLIDLHTTSANNGVFIVCKDDEKHKKMCEILHIPLVLNLDKRLNGTAMQYFWQKNIKAFTLEGGNHYDPNSIDKMESAIWLCLAYLGCIEPPIFSGKIEHHNLHLMRVAKDLPHICKIFYHHKIQEGDGFKMALGFSNFQRVKKESILASDVHGEIICPEDCYILMPLYQKQGSDGFFLIKST